MIVAAMVFFVALFGISTLFALKRWEKAHGRILAVQMRTSLDERALHLKELLEAGLKDLEKLVPALVHLSRVSLHLSAVGFGHLAHWLGERSHQLADMVSYKHRFERRALGSEFLKKMIRHKNGNNLDSEDENGQNR